MARASSPAGKATFLSPALAEFLRRRVLDGAGLLVLAIGLGLLLTLVSYAPSDPSHNFAQQRGVPVKNLLGSYGAIIADWLLRGLGVAGVALAAVISGWGWRILTRRGMSPLIPRLAVTPIGLVLLAAACAALATPAAWPLKHAGLGGFIGKPVLAGLMRLPNHLELPLSDGGTAFVCFVLAIALLTYALGGSLRQWRGAAGGAAMAVRTAFGAARWGVGAARRLIPAKRPALRLVKKPEPPRDRADPQIARRMREALADDEIEETAAPVVEVGRGKNAAPPPSPPDQAARRRDGAARGRLPGAAARPADRAAIPHQRHRRRGAAGQRPAAGSACSTISACAAEIAARSAPARSSRCTSWSRRPAPSPRASSAWPTTSPAP